MCMCAGYLFYLDTETVDIIPGELMSDPFYRQSNYGDITVKNT